MPSPAVVFGFLLATLYGSSLHFILGGDARRLALFLLVGWVGFALGQMLSDILNLAFVGIGMVNFCPATLGAYIGLFAAAILARREPTG